MFGFTGRAREFADLVLKEEWEAYKTIPELESASFVFLEDPRAQLFMRGAERGRWMREIPEPNQDAISVSAARTLFVDETQNDDECTTACKLESTIQRMRSVE